MSIELHLTDTGAQIRANAFDHNKEADAFAHVNLSAKGATLPEAITSALDRLDKVESVVVALRAELEAASAQLNGTPSE